MIDTAIKQLIKTQTIDGLVMVIDFLFNPIKDKLRSNHSQAIVDHYLSTYPRVLSLASGNAINICLSHDRHIVLYRGCKYSADKIHTANLAINAAKDKLIN